MKKEIVKESPLVHLPTKFDKIYERKMSMLITHVKICQEKGRRGFYICLK